MDVQKREEGDSRGNDWARNAARVRACAQELATMGNINDIYDKLNNDDGTPVKNRSLAEHAMGTNNRMDFAG